MDKTYCVACETPIGAITLVCSDKAVTALHFGADPAVEQTQNDICMQAARELREYFEGSRKEFSVPLVPAGTRFQRLVWSALCAIPYGETRTYGQIAAEIGNQKACRAVGMANNRNPIAILIPCHRVIGANGALTGYAGGLCVKESLLELEKMHKNS